MPSFERSSYPPIAEYAFLSDCEVGALVAPSGNVEWLCLPQFDSPSVFCPMLDRDVGRDSSVRRRLPNWPSNSSVAFARSRAVACARRAVPVQSRRRWELLC